MGHRRFGLPRIIRIALAAAVLAAAVAGFALSIAAAETAIRAIAAWQLFPLAAKTLRTATEGFAGMLTAAAVESAVLLAALFGLSAVFGRWYCAVLCPLGGLQDVCSFLGRRKRRYRKPASASRAISFVVAVALVCGGAMAFASLVDPWSIFSRFMAGDLQPLLRLAARQDNPGTNALNAAIPAACMAAVLVMAILRGRWFCGTLCPVGSVLGLLNKIAPLRVRLDESACVSCGACAARCPAACIDVQAKRLDSSRCVNCLACVGACPTKALRYGPSKKNQAIAERSISRGRFLASLGGGAAAIALSALPGKALFARSMPAASATVPPGARSRKRFLETCTACGLCASVCPSQVLQPSLGQLGPRGLFVPRLDYSVSYCQYECSSCLRACPSGALCDMPLERKKLTKIGDAALVKEKCIVIVQHTKCGACAECCPTGAVRMVVGSTGLPEPVFSSDICIGCGACHHACPATPVKAITVSGLAVHGIAKKPSLDLFAGQPATDSGAAGNAGSGEFPF
jgi:ferredoxin